MNGYIGLAAMHQDNETSYIQQLYDYKKIENPTFSMLLCKKGQCDSSLTIGGNSTAYAKEGAEEQTQKSIWIEGNDNLWCFEVDKIGFGERVYMRRKTIISTSQMYISLEERFFN